MGLLTAAFLFGKVINGAKGWILGIQPAEFVKIAVIITLASFFAKKQERQTPFFTRDNPPLICGGWIDGINFITK
ncbi:FtsW/RodA/SpoVE family cell cycle protein [Bacillus paranthracis]